MTDLTDAVIFLSLAFGVLLVVWLVRKAIRFALGPPPGAKEPEEFPYPIIVHLSLGDRLGDLEGSKNAINEARADHRRARDMMNAYPRPLPEDYDIDTITRQIESQN